jgi:hypothetical protein
VFFGKTVAKNTRISGCSTNIPYSIEQGIFPAEQEIEIPCSAESRDNSRSSGRPFDAFRRLALPDDAVPELSRPAA